MKERSGTAPRTIRKTKGRTLMTELEKYFDDVYEVYRRLSPSDLESMAAGAEDEEKRLFFDMLLQYFVKDEYEGKGETETCREAGDFVMPENLSAYFAEYYDTCKTLSLEELGDIAFYAKDDKTRFFMGAVNNYILGIYFKKALEEEKY